MDRHRKGYWKERMQLPKVKKYQKNYKKEYMKEYNKRPEVKSYKKEYEKTYIRKKDEHYYLRRRNWAFKRRQKYKNMILDIKKNCGRCKECGWNNHPEILQFHHRNKKEKELKFNTGNMGNVALIRIQKEIKKCDLLCPNCHLWHHYQETAGGGVVPSMAS